MSKGITLLGQRFDTTSLLFVSLAIIALILLGNWQITRLHAKTTFISQIEHNVSNPAVPFVHEARSDFQHYSKVSIIGKFLPGKNLFLYGRRSASPEKDGYYMISVFVDVHDNAYLVSRGWVPHAVKNAMHDVKNLNNSSIVDSSSGEHINNATTMQSASETIEAIILPGEVENFIVPQNDLNNNVWFTLDLEMASKFFNIKPVSFYLMQIDSQTLPIGGKALSTKHLSKVRNDHLEYAITWYSLAICLLVIFIVRSRQKFK